jgi:hypothetical protein
MDTKTKDKIVLDVMNKYNDRSKLGIEKYKTTLEDNHLELRNWLIHIQEELMDATLYIEKVLSLVK